MSIIVRCEQAYRTEIQIRQHTLIADEHIEDGGADEAPTPMEILIGTLGACIAVTTRAYAQRKGWALETISVEVELERFKGDEYPGIRATRHTSTKCGSRSASRASSPTSRKLACWQLPPSARFT